MQTIENSSYPIGARSLCEEPEPLLTREWSLPSVLVESARLYVRKIPWAVGVGALTLAAWFGFMYLWGLVVASSVPFAAFVFLLLGLPILIWGLCTYVAALAACADGKPGLKTPLSAGLARTLPVTGTVLAAALMLPPVLTQFMNLLTSLQLPMEGMGWACVAFNLLLQVVLYLFAPVAVLEGGGPVWALARGYGLIHGRQGLVWLLVLLKNAVFYELNQVLSFGLDRVQWADLTTMNLAVGVAGLVYESVALTVCFVVYAKCRMLEANRA